MNAREQILADVRIALRRKMGTPAQPIPPSARVKPRIAGDAKSEMAMLFDEINKLGGNTARVPKADLKNALAQIVQAQRVKKATLWQTEEIRSLGIVEILQSLGVEIVSPYADKCTLAECDLGITGADGALPETGTLLLRSTPEKPRGVSLLPRVHLAFVSPTVLRADVSDALESVKRDRYWIFVTGPSRTADIELTVTIGVHGPKALYAWTIE